MSRREFVYSWLGYGGVADVSSDYNHQILAQGIMEIGIDLRVISLSRVDKEFDSYPYS